MKGKKIDWLCHSNLNGGSPLSDKSLLSITIDSNDL